MFDGTSRGVFRGIISQINCVIHCVTVFKLQGRESRTYELSNILIYWDEKIRIRNRFRYLLYPIGRVTTLMQNELCYLTYDYDFMFF